MICKLYLAVSLLFLSFSGYSQENYAGGVDDEIIHFGFVFNYVSSEYKILKKSTWRNPYFDTDANAFVTDSLTSISSPTSPGFGLGFVSNFRLNNNLDVRFTPNLLFADRLIDYTYADLSKNKQLVIQSTMVELPLGIKLKSDRRKNFRAYVLAGAKYSMDIGSKKKNDDSANPPVDKLVKNLRNYISYEAGIGFDLYFEFFKLSPEIKLSNSYRSVLLSENHPYSAPLDKLFLRNLQFSLCFE